LGAAATSLSVALFFDNSRPDRAKRAKKAAGFTPRPLEASPIPPAKSYELFTVEEVLHGGDRTLVCDVESYPNYFLVSFQCVETGKVLYFEDSPEATIDTNALGWVMHRFTIVTFNGRQYDLPMIMIAMQGARAATLFEVTQQIIVAEMQPYEVLQRFNLTTRHINHIDLIEVAPLSASLKIYGGRIHCERIQDLPYKPNTWLTKEQALIVRDYNVNDLEVTRMLFIFLKPEIDLRISLGREYSQDLRSKSDAQIAEAVIVSELSKLGKVGVKPEFEPGQRFFYQPPDYLCFKTPQFQHAYDVICSTPFTVGNNGSCDCPPEIKALAPKLNQTVYELGVGGLHSKEKSVTHVATEDTLLIDRDVARYYPSIILNLGLYPQHLGPAFLDAFRGVVTKRDKAKLEKDKTTDQTLKIVINGTFGKLGNWYSKMHAPDLLIQTTVTGQLSLLMLIEMVELAGIEVVSANTDGIVMRVPTYKQTDLQVVIIAWEEATGFVTEETRYRSLHSRDVNNYIAVKEDGSTKTKGTYSERGSALNSVLSKNPEALICSDAVQAYLSKGVPIYETIERCKDIRRFVTVRQVKGGGEKDGVYLGKAVRWYYAKDEGGYIAYARSGNKVANSDGAKPLMILPSELPADLDYDRYVNDAIEMLYDLGVYRRNSQGTLF
jgi:hypothetical protein